MFLQHARLEIHPTHRITGFLTWEDLLFFAAVLMVHWIPQRAPLPQLARARSITAAAPAPSATAVSSSSDENAALAAGAGASPTPPSPLFRHLQQPRRSLQPVALVVENGAEIGLRAGDDWPSIAFLQERLHPLSVRATNGLDLGTRLTNSLRDLKAHLINDAETLGVYRAAVMAHLSARYSAEAIDSLRVKLYLIVHGVRLHRLDGLVLAVD